MVKYFIDNTEVQLKPKTVIALTLQYFNIVSMTETQTNFSNTFQIAKTNENYKFLELINLVSSSSNLPYEFLNSRLEINGFNFYGKSSIESFDEEGVSITFYGETINVFDLVNDLKLNQLDLSEFNHTWNFANVTNFRNNTEGCIYPIIDWSNNHLGFTGNNKVNPKYLLPAIFIKSILDKLFEQIGYQYEGELFSDKYFLNCVIPLQAKITDDTINKIKNTKAERIGQIIASKGPGAYIPNPQQNVLIFSTEIYDPFNIIQEKKQSVLTGNPYNPTETKIVTTTVFKPKIAGTYSFNNSATWKRPLKDKTGVVIENIKLGLYKVVNKVLVNEIGKQIRYINYDVQQVFNLSLNSTVELAEDEELFVIFTVTYVSWVGSHSLDVNYQTYLTENTIKVTDFVPENEEITYEDEIIVAGNLPDITCGDFLKTIKYLFGQIITVDSFSKKVYFNSIEKIKTTTAVDWSDKFHSLISIDFHPSLAKTNYFKYKNEDYLSETTGQGQIIIQDETLEKEKNIIQLPFSATESDGFNIIDTRIARIPIFEKVTEDLVTTIERTIDFKDRILLLNKLTGYENLTYSDGVAVDLVTNENIPYSYFANKKDADFDSAISEANKMKNGLDFQNVIENHYQIYNSIFDKFKSVKILAKLIESDIANFDFKKPIYLKQLGNIFYVNSINEFTSSDELTEVELIKL